MQYKRLEIYTWWKCNHKCVFCIEFPNMVKTWDKEVTRHDIMKKLIKYKKQDYNHVTFLWWEPFIHPVLHFATRFAKKLWYTTLVTTNASTVQFDKQAEKHLPTIDQIIISVPIINKEIQPIINDTKWVIDFEAVFQNIKKYWRGNFLKINTVINQYNLDEIESIIEFVGTRGAHEISITYPDITVPFYTLEHIQEKVAPEYKEVTKRVDGWVQKAKEVWISIKLVDIPFCYLPKDSYIELTDDYCYQTRLKVDNMEKEISREDYLPRRRKQVSQCWECVYKNVCWWPSIHYKDLYNISDITPVLEADKKIEWDFILKEQITSR